MKSFFSGFFLAAALAFSSAAESVSPQQWQQYVGKPVSKIKIISQTPEIPLDSSFVRGFMQTKPGDLLSLKTVSQEVRSLLDSQRFSYVDVKLEVEEDKPVLLVSVASRKRLAEVPEFSGFREISKSTAKKTAALTSGDYIDEQLARAAAARLTQLYHQRRYFDAKVSFTLKDSEGLPGNQTLTFTASEGKRYHIDFLKFPGATIISEDSLGEYARLHDWYNPLSWISSPRVSDNDLDIVAAEARRQYLEAGYLDAVVSAPEKERLPDHTIRVSYKVTEGALYTFGDCTIEGNTLFPESAVRSVLPIRKGAPASTKVLSEARTALTEYYTSRGYPDTVVRTTTGVSTGNVLHVTFSVKEGKLVHIRSVEIRGNVATKDKVIRREIGLAPGDLYNTVQAERAKNRLMNLGYFSDVRTFPVEGSDPSLRDIVFDVDEQPTGSLGFGVGFSSVDHLVGMFSISQNNFDILNWRNFRGGGQKIRFDLTIASESTDAELSFVEPWFLDRRLSLNTDFFVRNHEYDEYDQRDIGMEAGLQKMVPWVGRVGLSYGLNAISLSDVITDDFYRLSDLSDYRFTNEDDGYLLGHLALSWLYDTRDRALVPTRGTRARAQASLYNAVFGSDYDMYELSARINNYHRLPFGFLLALSADIATIDTFGDDEVPIGSRYFLGGARHIRGFKHRNVGPKAIYREDTTDFAPIGGQTRFWATAELSLPLIERIRAAAFYDLGGVWEDAFDLQFDSLCSSYGFGLRFDFPAFPIRLDYALPIDKADDYMRERKLVFWIGFDN